MEEKKTKAADSSTVQLVSIILVVAALGLGVFLEANGTKYALITWLVASVVIFMFGTLIAYALELLEKILAALRALAEDYQSMNFKK